MKRSRIFGFKPSSSLRRRRDRRTFGRKKNKVGCFERLEHRWFLSTVADVEPFLLGDMDNDQDVNFIEPGSIHGVKWVDANGNAERDRGEPGLPGVVIYSDLNFNGERDRGEPHTRTMRDNPRTDFDEAGHYRLRGLRKGRHVIREVVPDGFEQTFPPSVSILPPGAHVVFVEPGGEVDGIDFGNRSRPPEDIYASDGSKIVIAPGDTDANGEVNSSDLFAILAANKFNNPEAGPASWADGDFNGDALVNSADLFLMLETNKFNQGSYASTPTHSDSSLAIASTTALLDDAKTAEDARTRDSDAISPSYGTSFTHTTTAPLKSSPRAEAVPFAAARRVASDRFFTGRFDVRSRTIEDQCISLSEYEPAAARGNETNAIWATMVDAALEEEALWTGTRLPM